jgi:hypothetical protein
MRLPCRAVHSAVFPSLSRVAASRAVNPLVMMARARSSFSPMTTDLHPPFRPRQDQRECVLDQVPLELTQRTEELGD